MHICLIVGLAVFGFSGDLFAGGAVAFMPMVASAFSVATSIVGMMGGGPDTSSPSMPAAGALPATPTADNAEAAQAKELARLKAARIGQSSQTNVTKGTLESVDASTSKPTLLGG